MAKKTLATRLKDNFEAIAKLRERSKELQRLLTVGPISIKEEERLAEEFLLVIRTIRRLENERLGELRTAVPEKGARR
jgi:hypothetical protein